jgi:group I intron endonuclease
MTEIKNIPGIYKLTNTINSKFYIGSAVDLRKRRNHHFHMLRMNKHHNSHLQAAFNKYGELIFSFDVIEEIPRLENESNTELKIRLIDDKEQYYLNTLLFAQEYIKNGDKRFFEIGYNLNPIASGMLGYKHSKETIKNMSKAVKRHHKLFPEKYSGKNAPWYGKKGKDHPNSRPLLQFDKNGHFIKEWECMAVVERELNLSHSNIHSCCNGIYKTSGGFMWKFKDPKNVK